MKRVILCADDFAVHESASRGIAQLARLGRISATSAMVLAPRWAQDAALLHELRGRIDVGLHLDWTSEFALAAGHGMRLRDAMLKAALGRFDRAATRGVIERQLDAFEAQWKEPPDHVDGHQHVQQFAGIREALVQTVASRYGERKPTLRISRPPPGATSLKSRFIAALGARALETLAKDARMGLTPYLLGVYDFSLSQAQYGRRMQAWLRAAPAHSCIMCHPALAAEPGDAIGAAREREGAYLASADFAAALTHSGVQLVRATDR